MILNDIVLTDLRYFDKSTPPVLFDIEVEPFALNLEHLCGQLLLRMALLPCNTNNSVFIATKKKRHNILQREFLHTSFKNIHVKRTWIVPILNPAVVPFERG